MKENMSKIEADLIACAASAKIGIKDKHFFPSDTYNNALLRYVRYLHDQIERLNRPTTEDVAAFVVGGHIFEQAVINNVNRVVIEEFDTLHYNKSFMKALRSILSDSKIVDEIVNSINRKQLK